MKALWDVSGRPSGSAALPGREGKALLQEVRPEAQPFVGPQHRCHDGLDLLGRVGTQIHGVERCYFQGDVGGLREMYWANRSDIGGYVTMSMRASLKPSPILAHVEGNPFEGPLLGSRCILKVRISVCVFVYICMYGPRVLCVTASTKHLYLTVILASHSEARPYTETELRPGRSMRIPYPSQLRTAAPDTSKPMSTRWHTVDAHVVSACSICAPCRPRVSDSNGYGMDRP
jgi:hypothetical protein